MAKTSMKVKQQRPANFQFVSAKVGKLIELSK